MIAKTKMIQLETSNKDLERKNRVFADTIKIYESEQNKILKDKYFQDQSSPDISAPSSANISPGPISSNLSSYLGYKTIDRLLNYFLDVVQQIPRSQNISSDSSVPASTSSPFPSSATAPPQEKVSDSICSPQTSESVPGQSAVLLQSPISVSLSPSPSVILPEIDSLLNKTSHDQQPTGDTEGFVFDNNESSDAADGTIDEFMDIGHNDALPAQQSHLNSHLLTTQ